MAFRRGKGLRYFPLVTDFFQDRDIRRLVYKCGQKGVLLYIYILCALYAQGYALKWDEDILQDAAVDLQSNTDELQEVLNYLLEKGLFDRGIFDSYGMLTSKAVQRQFQDCVRVMRRKVCPETELWLLDEEETNGYILINSGKEGSNSGKEGSNSGISTQRKGKEKENKNKLNERKEEEGLPQRQNKAIRSCADASVGTSTDDLVLPFPIEGQAFNGGPMCAPRNDKLSATPKACHSEEARSADVGIRVPGEQLSTDLLTHYRERIDLGGRAEEELGRYRAELGEELCRHALHRALEMDKPLWSYVRAILKSYSASGYRELQQVLQEEQRHRESYGLSGRNVRASCRYPPVDMEKLGEIYKRI